MRARLTEQEENIRNNNKIAAVIEAEGFIFISWCLQACAESLLFIVNIFVPMPFVGQLFRGGCQGFIKFKAVFPDQRVF